MSCFSHSCCLVLDKALLLVSETTHCMNYMYTYRVHVRMKETLQFRTQMNFVVPRARIEHIHHLSKERGSEGPKQTTTRAKINDSVSACRMIVLICVMCTPIRTTAHSLPVRVYSLSPFPLGISEVDSTVAGALASVRLSLSHSSLF